jgi:hypothetical protein
LVTGLQSVCALNAKGVDPLVRNLLAGAYRHPLNEVRDWLVELMAAIDDPFTALQRRGLPTTGQIEIPITLKLTQAPQLAGENGIRSCAWPNPFRLTL